MRFMRMWSTEDGFLDLPRSKSQKSKKKWIDCWFLSSLTAYWCTHLVKWIIPVCLLCTGRQDDEVVTLDYSKGTLTSSLMDSIHWPRAYADRAIHVIRLFYSGISMMNLLLVVSLQNGDCTLSLSLNALLSRLHTCAIFTVLQWQIH